MHESPRTLRTLALALVLGSGLTAPLSAEPVSPPSGGEVVLSVMPKSNQVQRSNFGKNSFTLTNTGEKPVLLVFIDVTSALYPDVVFDPEGLAGDSVAKPLKLDTPGGTGVAAPSAAPGPSYEGPGGALGYRGIRLAFDPEVDGGFEPGESVGFSIDMDPNSIAGTRKPPLDQGASPKWDVGGVSGAEMIGSRFNVVFTDGSSARGQLHGTKTQAGSHGLASQAALVQGLNFWVNGVESGGVGVYGAQGFKVVVRGPAGQTARVVLTRGCIQPATPYAGFLTDQLRALAASRFPANNAVDFQTVDVLLTGEDQDLTDRFDVSGKTDARFVAKADQPFSADAHTLPLGVVAAVIDAEREGLPIGPVTEPIYLTFE
ncbi:MAG: hypothetical protein AAGI68_10725 [Planctomycetota bacterium]